MNKVVTFIICLVVILMAVIIGINMYNNSDEDVEKEKTQITKVSEEIIDECTEEWEELEESTKDDLMQVNSSSEKVSPTCSITFNKYYKGCNHTTSEYMQVSNDLVNMTQQELQQRYDGWEIKQFSSNEIVMYKEFEGECAEHYVLKDKDGKIVIYRITETGEEIEYQVTEISTEYLTQTDRDTIKSGIRVNGKQELNQLIEDFE